MTKTKIEEAISVVEDHIWVYGTMEWTLRNQKKAYPADIYAMVKSEAEGVLAILKEALND